MSAGRMHVRASCLASMLPLVCTGHQVMHEGPECARVDSSNLGLPQVSSSAHSKRRSPLNLRQAGVPSLSLLHLNRLPQGVHRDAAAARLAGLPQISARLASMLQSQEVAALHDSRVQVSGA